MASNAAVLCRLINTTAAIDVHFSAEQDNKNRRHRTVKCG